MAIQEEEPLKTVWEDCALSLPTERAATRGLDQGDGVSRRDGCNACRHTVMFDTFPETRWLVS
jgi:hypothetical protein